MYRKLSTLGSVLLFAFIALLLPLYVPLDGYAHIGTQKYYFFLIGMTVFVAGGMSLFIYSIYVALRKKTKPNLSKTDLFTILFATCCIVSYFFSIDKKIALTGNEEWHLGLVSQLLFVFIYFVISRSIGYVMHCIYAVCIAGIPMALLAVVNRFGFYPIAIPGSHPLYISTIGNINWFCGFFIIITAMELVLYFNCKTIRQKLFFGMTLFISLAAIICQGSISGYVALFVLLLLLLKPALSCKQSFLTYLEIYLLLFSGCTLLYITGYFIPNAYVEYDPIVKLVAFSVLPCICLFFVIALYIIIYFNTKTIHLIFLYKYVVCSVISLLILYLIMCFINTLFPTATPYLNGISFFTFDRFWWSTRGGTYTIGIQAYASLPWYHLLFGIGPDCFLTYVYNNLDKVTVAKSFRVQPLANAHNELLTMLVDTGFFGFITYAGIFITSIKNTYKKTNPFIKVILFGILGYMINNLFSFQQVVSTPFVFALLGILENLLRKERNNASN